jgi:hypothetical protein
MTLEGEVSCETHITCFASVVGIGVTASGSGSLQIYTTVASSHLLQE